MKRRGIHRNPINVRSVSTLVGIEYLIEVAQTYLKDYSAMEAYLPRMISLLREELNTLLVKVSPLGTDTGGKPILSVSQTWIKEIDVIYSILDEEGKGSLDGDRIQFFLLSLILNELKE